jgi:hypothetical protein
VCCNSNSHCYSVKWGCSTRTCTCAHSGPLHRSVASAQQPPPGRLPVPELAEGGHTKPQQLHHQWKGQGGLRHWRRGGNGLKGHQNHTCSPQPHGNGGGRRGLHAPRPGFTAPTLGNKTFFFFFKGLHLW